MNQLPCILNNILHWEAIHPLNLICIRLEWKTPDLMRWHDEALVSLEKIYIYLTGGGCLKLDDFNMA